MSTVENRELDPKDPAEIIPVTFDFTNDTTAPLTPVVSISRHSGAPDTSDLSLMLSGSPQIIGAKVVQKVRSGVDGTNYRIACQADEASGLRYVIAGILPVATA